METLYYQMINYILIRNSWARLVTEGALGRLKIKFRVLSRKCESNKETLKFFWPALCFTMAFFRISFLAISFRSFSSWFNSLLVLTNVYRAYRQQFTKPTSYLLILSKMFKGYLRYKTIIFQNVPSKAQIKSFFIS